MPDGPTDSQIEETAETVEQADEDVTRSQRWYAYAYLTTLFGLIVGSLGLSVWLGIINPSLSLSAHVQVGWVVEYLIVGVVGAFLLFTFAMVLVALPGSILGGMVRLSGGIWQAFGGEDGE